MVRLRVVPLFFLGIIKRANHATARETPTRSVLACFAPRGSFARGRVVSSLCYAQEEKEGTTCRLPDGSLSFPKIKDKSCFCFVSFFNFLGIKIVRGFGLFGLKFLV